MLGHCAVHTEMMSCRSGKSVLGRWFLIWLIWYDLMISNCNCKGVRCPQIRSENALPISSPIQSHRPEGKAFFAWTRSKRRANWAHSAHGRASKIWEINATWMTWTMFDDVWRCLTMFDDVWRCLQHLYILYVLYILYMIQWWYNDTHVDRLILVTQSTPH